jgi:PhnB protein
MALGVTVYVKNSREAVAFYCDAFNMKIGYNVKHDNDSYLHAELEKNGNCGFAVSESNDENTRKVMLVANQPTMSLGINLDNDEELKTAYEKIIVGGHILRPIGSLPWSPCSADVVDKYGVCWYIYVNQHRPDEAE